jgi:hypothetical protein
LTAGRAAHDEADSKNTDKPPPRKRDSHTSDPSPGSGSPLPGIPSGGRWRSQERRCSLAAQSIFGGPRLNISTNPQTLPGDSSPVPNESLPPPAEFSAADRRQAILSGQWQL